MITMYSSLRIQGYDDLALFADNGNLRVDRDMIDNKYLIHFRGQSSIILVE